MFGWLLINYAALDVAPSGANSPILHNHTCSGPQQPVSHVSNDAMEQTCQAAAELDIAIVRGHTGMYDSVNDLVRRLPPFMVR